MTFDFSPRIFLKMMTKIVMMAQMKTFLAKAVKIKTRKTVLKHVRQKWRVSPEFDVNCVILLPSVAAWLKWTDKKEPEGF